MKKAFIFLHSAVLLAGFTGLFGKLITLNAILISWYRLLFAGIILFIILAVSGNLRKITGRNFLRIAFTGTLLGLHWIFFYASIKYSNISVGVVCFALASFFTALFEPILNRKKIAVSELLLSSLVLIGIALIFGFDKTFRTGIIMGVISSIIIAFYTVYNERLTKVFSSSTITLYTMLGGAAGLTFIIPLFVYFARPVTIIPPLYDFGYLLLLSLVCTVLLYFLLIKALKVISAFTVNITFNLEPLYTIVLAIIFYHENKALTLSFYAGLLLIILSVLLQMVRVFRKHRNEAIAGYTN